MRDQGLYSLMGAKVESVAYSARDADGEPSIFADVSVMLAADLDKGRGEPSGRLEEQALLRG